MIAKRQIIRFRYILCSVTFIIVLLLVWNERRRIQALEPYRIMPEICALDMFGDSINCKNILNPEMKTAILFFSPDCNSCRNEINDILQFRNEFRDIQWVFITVAQYEDLDCFLNEYPIHLLPDAYLLREDYPINHMLFNVSVPPALFVYDKKGTLIAKHKGEILIQSIAKDLN